MTSSSLSSPEISAPLNHDPQLAQFSYKHASHDEVLEELSSRFIVNLPDEELESLERICFQVEQAHWFYEDFIREENPKLPTLPLKKFSAMLFHACPLLHRWRETHEDVFNQFMAYKTRVPVCGAIMLNHTMDKCVLVKGWKASSGWGFPKGKINQSEPPVDCAVREVLEETGYDLSSQIVADDVLTVNIKDQIIYLYIVSGISEDYPFQTKTRKEISKIEWFRLVDLPTWRRNKPVPGKFYLISPFISGLKSHIHQRKLRSGRGGRVRRSPAPALPTTEEEEETTDDLASTERDGHAESSSQSSGDNVDPQTPSPQYIQARVNAAPQIVTSQTEALDPHMARLLSSLTLSANPSGPRNTQSDDVPATIVKQTKAPSPIPAVDEPELQRTITQPLGSSREVKEPPVSSPRLTSPTSNRSSSRPNPVTPLSPSSPPSVASTVSPRSRGLGSRRTSSTADISPYLSRAFEPPSSAKTLRQLALLEAIASESEKMTPTLSSRALPPLTSNASFVDGRPPAFPVSSPFTTAMPPPDDLRVIYSSQPVAGLSNVLPPQGNSFTPAPYPPAHIHPYQLRPHTSHSYHRGVPYLPTNVMPGHVTPFPPPPNLVQPQLYPNQSPLPLQHPALRRQYQQPAPTSNVESLLQPLPPMPAVPHAIPYGTHMTQPPITAPGFHGPNPLLSILNDKAVQS
ncbi:hypothetical protein ONZ45_g873 [Pleurotus djamor]|nr:hypothetical protein ONZ45_g873 [Pleurotus djamor]